MAQKLYEESNIQAIADAIRAKNGSTNTYKTSEMAAAISAITVGGGITPTGTKTITSNGTYDVTEYASAFVNVTSGGGGSGSGSSTYHQGYLQTHVSSDDTYITIDDVTAMPQSIAMTSMGMDDESKNAVVALIYSVSTNTGWLTYMAGGKMLRSDNILIEFDDTNNVLKVTLSLEVSIYGYALFKNSYQAVISY